MRVETATRLFGFDYGHRVLNHGGKCASLHGHRGTAEVTCVAPKLDALGMVIDFGKIKELVGNWIDENWDHTMLLHPDDPMWKNNAVVQDGRVTYWDIPTFGPRKPYLMPCNPTAENMAGILLEKSAELLAPLGITVTSVKLWETPNCFAQVTR